MSSIDEFKQLPVDDWADQDLLTKAEAGERLDDEISRTRARLDEVLSTAAPDDAEVALLTRWLNAMRSVKGEYDDHRDGK